MLPSVISESCSLATSSDVTSGILPQVIIYPSSTNDIIDVITCYNSTYSEYEKIYTLKIHDTLCTIDIKDIDSWALKRFEVLYRMICHHQTPSTKDYCISLHNSDTLYNIKVTLNSMFQVFCASGNNNVQKIRMSGIDNHLAELSNKNKELESKLKQVTQERDKLNAKVESLSADKLLLEHNIQQLNKKLTTAQDTVQELQSNLNRTNHELESSNYSLRLVSQVLTKLKGGVGDTFRTLDVKQALNDFEAQQANYTNYQDTNERNKKSIDTLLSNAQHDLETRTQEVKKLELALQQKDIELNNTYTLLNISISSIDNIKANITQISVKHNISQRDINNQYNETQDSYVVSQQITEDTYEARVADSERKVEEILTIFTSLEKENNILKSQIPQSEIINKVEDYNSDIKDGFIKNTQNNYNNTSLIVLPDDYTSAINSTNKSIGSAE
ncbi:hypothetical protein PV328_012289, partial [Microctonus aethiopoides]